MNKTFWLLFFSVVLLASCQMEYPGVPEKYHTLLDTAMVVAGENSGELEMALKSSSKEQKEATAFLIAYMPDKDLKSLSSDFILDQVNGAFKARKEFEWCRNLPDSIFLNEVLPYNNLDENRDNWREDFYARFSPLVQDCSDIYEAIDSVNLNIKEVLGVE